MPILLRTSVQDTGVITKLNFILNKIQTRDIIDEANAVLLNRIRTNFLNETTPNGARWTPSKAGLARRAHGGTGTLFDTGTLFHSIQAASTGLYSSDIFTDVPYAPSIQGQNNWEFLGWGAQDQVLLNAIVVRRLNQVLGGTV